ncbi:MAG: helix-turn-helix domain-containing protein [bacterium]
MQPSEVRFKPWQRRRLLEQRDHAPTPRVFKRAACLLMSAAGHTAVHIAEVLGLSRDAVSDIRRRWHERGLASLVDRPRSGRPPRVTPAYRRALGRALDRSPLSFGYAFTTWSIARLNTHLRQTTGITIGDEWLRKLVHEEGFVVGRPKHTLANKRDAHAYRQAKRLLDRRKKGRSSPRRDTSCGTPT